MIAEGRWAAAPWGWWILREAAWRPSAFSPAPISLVTRSCLFTRCWNAGLILSPFTGCDRHVLDCIRINSKWKQWTCYGHLLKTGGDAIERILFIKMVMFNIRLDRIVFGIFSSTSAWRQQVVKHCIQVYVMWGWCWWDFVLWVQADLVLRFLRLPRFRKTLQKWC